MRRFIWLWVLVAFVVGLAPGLGLFLYTRGSYVASNRRLLTRNADLTAANQKLHVQLEAAEASASALAAQAGSTPGSSASGPGTGDAGSAPTGGTPKIIARSVTPASAAAGAKITLTVKLTGHADAAHMRIAGPGGFDKTYYLARTGLDNGAEVWQTTIRAPSSAGTYAYYGIALAGAARYPMPGTKGYTFTVK